MSAIPNVRRWIVNYWRNGKCVRTEKVDTINKDFARYMATQQSGYFYDWDKRTVSLAPYQRRINA